MKRTRAPGKRPERRAPPSTNPNEDTETSTVLTEGEICTQYLRAHIGTVLASYFDGIDTVIKDPTMALEFRTTHRVKCGAGAREIRRPRHARVEEADQYRQRDCHRERRSRPERRLISSNQDLLAHNQIMSHMQTPL